jgi:hypothetical protein
VCSDDCVHAMQLIRTLDVSLAALVGQEGEDGLDIGIAYMVCANDDPAVLY